MKKILILSINDFKQVFRDRLLQFFLFMPILLIFFVRYFVPYIASIYPAVSEYYDAIVIMASMQNAILFGFISTFVILDEKDERVLQAIRVLPISPEFFIAYRLLFATIFSATGAFLMMQFCNLPTPPVAHQLILSLLFGLAAPLITLIITSYANNKVEGLAFFKGIDLLLLLPILGFFFSGSWKFLFSALPVFWIYEYYGALSAQQNYWFYPVCAGIAYGIWFFVLFKSFKKRVFAL